MVQTISVIKNLLGGRMSAHACHPPMDPPIMEFTEAELAAAATGVTVLATPTPARTENPAPAETGEIRALLARREKILGIKKSYTRRPFFRLRRRLVVAVELLDLELEFLDHDIALAAARKDDPHPTQQGIG